MPDFDSAQFRRVLGHFPTGVAIITAMGGGRPEGMAIGSFTSVSLHPPLVGFFPGKASSTWPRMRDAGGFCVNILGEDGERLSRVFSSKVEDKFAGVGWRAAPASGAPLLDDVLAWVDCTTVSITEAGDHEFVLGEVQHLDVVGEGGPLVFFRGGYGRFQV